jgi:hypothetical protein
MSLLLKFGGITSILILVLTNYKNNMVMDQLISSYKPNKKVSSGKMID